MRCIVGLCLFALAVPFGASDVGNPDPAFESLTSWKGRHSDELIAAWGKPRKTRRDGKDGKVLVYRVRFFGKEGVGETKTSWSAAGVGPSSDQNSGRDETVEGIAPKLVFAGGPEVIATQKAKFYVDRQGIIQREEFAPRKWKKKKP